MSHLVSFCGWRGLRVIGIFLAFCLVLASCKSDYPASARQNPPGGARGEPKQVKMASVSETPVGEAVAVTGTLAAQDQATLSVKVPGRLKTIAVDLGSSVRKGQVIGQVEPQDYELRVQQAQAALGQARARLGLPPEGDDDRVNAEQTGTVRQARATLEESKANRERALKLVEQGVVAKAEFDSVDASYKVALSQYQDALEEIRNRQAMVQQRRAELALAKQQLADTAIISPFDGMVQERRATVGEFLAAGAPVVTIVRVDPLRFRGEVPERDARSVRTGQSVRLTVEGDANLYSGRIVRLSPTISEQNRILVVEAEVRNQGTLRPGAFAKADIVTSNSSMAVTVPNRAVTVFAGIEKVITVQDGKALEKPITTGRRSDDWTEVLSGVNVGEKVVLDPGNLQSGQTVNVVE